MYLAFLHVLTFHEAAQSSIRHKILFSMSAPLGDFGCHSGARWILKGFPNRPFSYKTNINYQKMMARSGACKNLKLWRKVIAKRREVTKRFSHYFCYNRRGLAGCEILSIIVFGAIGSDFRYLGAFFFVWNVDEFWSKQKSIHKLENLQI